MRIDVSWAVIRDLFSIFLHFKYENLKRVMVLLLTVLILRYTKNIQGRTVLAANVIVLLNLLGYLQLFFTILQVRVQNHRVIKLQNQIVFAK